MSEHDVIERIFNAFDADYCERFGIVHDREKGHQAMLAAVRELHAIAVAPGHAQGTLMTQNWLSDRITDHERRAGGKGE